ncbi:MAG: SH3 domain-containing protein [Bacilli bacterium]|nr:SH3 domain-containing protein [Bacilli bacterium]
MKKIIIILSIILISFFGYTSKNDALAGYTTGTQIRVRPEPNTNNTSLFIINDKNTVLDLVDDTLYPATPGCSVGWYKINYQGTQGYVCGDFVSIGNPGDNNPSYNEETFQARINDVRVSVRPTPSYSNSAIHVLLPGTNVVILGKEQGTGCSGGWYKVKYFKNSTGYVCSNYVKTKEELTGTNAEYENYLKGLGFPDTYIPYLVKLHEQHPTWTFNPVKTNVAWDNFVSIETNNNVVNKEYLNSIVDPVYQLGPYKEAGWYITTNEVNAFYLDPRNFLTESFIFMFERLNYDYANESKGTFNKENNQTKYYYNIITKLLSSSYANNDDYKYWFLKAGYDAGVSPVYLTSLSYQEGPLSNPSNASILGTHSSFFYVRDKNDNIVAQYDVNGYYNFYNIYATWTQGNSPTTTTLAYACGSRCSFNDTYERPWNTKEKAIHGGAQKIYDDYIGVGQNTMYFKKFNSSPNSIHSIGSHQYQTNVTAPCSESINSYEAYKKSNNLENNFIFDIPIYENMPSVVSLPEIASTINTLEEIKINGVKITYGDKDILDYLVFVPKSAATVKVEVVKTDEKSTVSGTGTINLSGDQTEHQIIVTAENGLTKTYRLTILKAEDEDIKDLTVTFEDVTENLSIVDDKIINHVSPGTVADTIKQSILKKNSNTKVQITDRNGKSIDGGNILTTGSRITITLPIGISKTYTIIINGDTNGDGKVDIIDLLRVQKSILGSTTLNEIDFKGADTNFDGKVDIIDLLRVQKYILGVTQL